MNNQNLPNRFDLTGQVLNIFQAPSWEKDGKSGGGDYRMQLLSIDRLRNGEVKVIPTEVSLGDESSLKADYEARIGQVVRVPVSVFAIGGTVKVSLAGECEFKKGSSAAKD